MTDLHTAIALGIDRGLRDLGADVTGCTPSMLTGHVINELKAARLHPNPGAPVSPDAETVSSRVSSQAGRWPLDHDVDRVVAEYAALPECEACGGSGKDDHATVFETQLAVHFAGPPCEIAGRRRQLCMWCGHVLLDNRSLTDEHGNPSFAPPWPTGALVKVEDGVATEVHQDAAAELPPGCCALPDQEDEPDEPSIVDVELPPMPDEDQAQAEPTCACGVPARRCSCRIADLCKAAAKVLDENGPDQAQETRAAADWPPEPVDTHADES